MIRPQPAATTAAYPRHVLTGPAYARRPGVPGRSDAVISGICCALATRQWMDANRTSPFGGRTIGPKRHPSDIAGAHRRRRNGDMSKDAIPTPPALSPFRRMTGPAPSPKPSHVQHTGQLSPDLAAIPHPGKAGMPTDDNGKHSSFRHQHSALAKPPEGGCGIAPPAVTADPPEPLSPICGRPISASSEGP